MRTFCVLFSFLCLFLFFFSACSNSSKTDSSSSTKPPGTPGPAADFTASPKSGSAPLDVQFTSVCTGTIDSYSWDFGDGGTSAQPSPSHIYAADGTYSVVLTVAGSEGSDTEIKVAFISVGSASGGDTVTADFVGSPNAGTAPLTVEFTDTSTPAGEILSWSWEFGDGTSSSEQNPSHEYASVGTYAVSLTVTGSGGSDTETKSSYITVNEQPTGTDDWVKLTSGTSNDLYGISFGSASSGWVVGLYDTMLHTGDGGGSWTSQFGNIAASVRSSKESSAHAVSPPPYYDNAHFLCVHAVDANTAWISSLGPCHGLNLTPCFVTKNGGGTWTCLATATNFQEWAIYGFDGGAARVCTIGSSSHPDSDIQIIEGGYDTNSYPISWGGLYAIGFGDADTGWTGGQDFYKSTDGGSSWSQISKPSGTGTILDIAAVSATTAWACSTGGRIIKTEDGSSWTSLTSGVSVDLWGIDFVNANNGWCVGAGGTILVTTDGGATWTAQDSGTASTLTDVSAVDAGHVWACGANGLILRSQ